MGVGPNIARNAIINAVELATYDTVGARASPSQLWRSLARSVSAHDIKVEAGCSGHAA